MRLDESVSRRWVSLIHAFLEQFGWLADSFVLDFYVDNHWGKLPRCWAHFLDTLTPNKLACLLDLDNATTSHWWSSEPPPLSLLAFKQTVRVLSISRKYENMKLFETDTHDQEVDPDIKNLFTRHVKLKKRHEVEKMGHVISNVCSETGATHVYDVGSGLGHLSRYLAYAHGLNLTCVDSNQSLSVGATKFDTELEKFLSKKKLSALLSPPPSHKNLRLELNHHERYFQNRDHKFGLIGLHACGNLSPVVLHNYVNSPSKFVVSVGCCYMKMDGQGFPLSNYAKGINLRLSYEALEVACHAIEQYCDRLRDNDNVNKLKTHAYRATLETILVTHYGIKRAGLRSVPHTEKLTFQEYAKAATRSLEIELHQESVELSTPSMNSNLSKWFRVVVFYSLRLLLANVIESVVLLDRTLFLHEQNSTNSNVKVIITPLFDPKISPRNLALISWETT